MNPHSRNILARQPATRPSAGRPWRPNLVAFLPAILFAAFLLPNTRIPFATRLMLVGRWGVLLAVVVLALLIRRNAGIKGLSPTIAFLFFCFLIFGVLLPFAANPVLAGAKWFVFFLFLIFCLLVTSNIESSVDIEKYLYPLGLVFTVFVWINPVGFLILPRIAGYGIAGFMKNPNGLGLYLVAFGLPLMLYYVETATRDRQRKFFLFNSVLASVLVIQSASRAAAFAAAVILSVGFWRWQRFNGRRIMALKLLVIGGAFAAIPLASAKIQSYVYKYPNASSILESRAPFWDATHEAFLENRWTGSGFGIQESEQESSLSYTTAYKKRRGEQGSTILGLLEEVGIIGSGPFFLLLIITGFRQTLILWLSHNPLQILFARSILAGLIWAVAENYMLHLGNAASILVFLSLFFSERLLQIHRREKAAGRQSQFDQDLRLPQRQIPQPARAF